MEADDSRGKKRPLEPPVQGGEAEDVNPPTSSVVAVAGGKTEEDNPLLQLKFSVPHTTLDHAPRTQADIPLFILFYIYYLLIYLFQLLWRDGAVWAVQGNVQVLLLRLRAAGGPRHRRHPVRALAGPLRHVGVLPRPSCRQMDV